MTMTRILQLAVFLLSLGFIMSRRCDRSQDITDESKTVHPHLQKHDDDLPDSEVQTNSEKVQRKIVAYHNYFRSRVQPPAANMLRMKWHKGAAETAQKWADACKYLTHDDGSFRIDEKYGQCGQNIFAPPLGGKMTWFEAVKGWDAEKNNFTYGSDHDLMKVGHYTQVVWATTHKVGCGYADCLQTKENFYNYVCNYCPTGNMDLSKPYKRGEKCSSCKESCSKQKLCTNECPFQNIYNTCDNSSSPPDCKAKDFGGCKATCKCKGKIYFIESEDDFQNSTTDPGIPD